MKALVGLLTVLCVVGCDDPGDIVEAHRPALQAKLDALRQIGGDVSGRAAATDADLDVPSDANFGRNGNGLIVSPNQLADPTAGPEEHWENMPAGSSYLYPSWASYSDAVVIPIAHYLRDGDFESDPQESVVQFAVDGLSRMKYALVVRVQHAVPPRLQGDEIEANDIETFQSGGIVGDVLLYNLGSGSFLDSATYEVLSPAEADVYNEDIAGQLRSELIRALGEKIDGLTR